MKSLTEYITEKKKGGYMWLTTGDGRIEIWVTMEDYNKGVAVYMVKDQMKKYSDKLILDEINEFGTDYTMDDFKNREDLIATFLEYSDDYWEEDDAPLK